MKIITNSSHDKIILPVMAFLVSYVGIQSLPTTNVLSNNSCNVTSEVFSCKPSIEKISPTVEVYSPDSTDPALSRNFNRLGSMRGLKEGWFNGHPSNENAFSNKLVNRVATILSRLKNQPEVFPTGRNSIQIEFEKSNGDYLEFELFEDGKISKYYSDSIKSYSRNVSEKNIFKSVKEFYDN